MKEKESSSRVYIHIYVFLLEDFSSPIYPLSIVLDLYELPTL
jgi:hypothetical protein